MIKNTDSLSQSFEDCAHLIFAPTKVTSVDGALELFSNEILSQFSACLVSILNAHYNVDLISKKPPARLECKESDDFKGGTIHFITTNHAQDDQVWNAFLKGFSDFTNDFKKHAENKCVAIHATDQKSVVVHFTNEDMLFSLRSLIDGKFRDHKALNRNLNLVEHLYERVGENPSYFKPAAKLH